jgi:hypothetical protein
MLMLRIRAEVAAAVLLLWVECQWGLLLLVLPLLLM